MIDCKDELCNVLVDWIIPACTIGFTNIVYLCSIPAVRSVSQSQILGKLNPLPFAWQIFLGLVFILYGFMLGDITIFASNFCGFILGLWYTCIVLPLASRLQQRLVMLIMLIGSVICFGASAMTFIVFKDKGLSLTFNQFKDYRTLPMNIASVLIITAFYSSPVLGIFQVIRQKDARSLYLPLTIASLFTGISWTAYGYILGNIWLMVPNSFTMFFAIISLVCKFAFRHSPTETDIESAVRKVMDMAQTMNK